MSASGAFLPAKNESNANEKAFSGVAPPALSKVSAFLLNCRASVSWATGPLPFRDEVGPP